MNPSRATVVALGVSAILVACGWGAARGPAADDPERAAALRSLGDTAARVAVSKTGVRVCRQTAVGISERDWIRGVVVEVAAEKIRVRIDDPGRFPQTLDGLTLARGLSVWDTPLRWTPCN